MEIISFLSHTYPVIPRVTGLVKFSNFLLTWSTILKTSWVDHEFLLKVFYLDKYTATIKQQNRRSNMCLKKIKPRAFPKMPFPLTLPTLAY